MRIVLGVGIILVWLPRWAYADDKPAGCAACHRRQAAEFAKSVHASLRCQECHVDEDADSPTSDTPEHRTRPRKATGAFDHGPSFKGKPARLDIPTLCGTCHADVERMNPFGLRTDQLARYLTSRHGKQLTQEKDERVAVCIDCHGAHDILRANDPTSRTHPLNVPDTCGNCHADQALMDRYGLPVEVVDEYRKSIHGRLLLEQNDTGAPTCATCHGNHSAMPPGFDSVGAVCGQCHSQVAKAFEETGHASQPDFKGCVQCHGGGPDRHFHSIQRITNPAGLMVQRYKRLVDVVGEPTPEQITDAIHPAASRIMRTAVASCTDCHDEEDEEMEKLFGLLGRIADAERAYVRTALRLEEMGHGVLLVDKQRYEFEDAKTHLIALGALQHTLDEERVAEEISQLTEVCDRIDGELDGLESGLKWRHQALIPIWIFAVLFSIALYANYRRLKAAFVKPLPPQWKR